MVNVAILGGGASGCFSAIQIKSFSQGNLKIRIFEKSKEPLSKLRVSGGGRCNVTHSLFEPEALSRKYPRGEKELRWAFEIFQPRDTIAWFKERGVELKTEDDGRIFPTTNLSSTIIECFLHEIQKNHISLELESPVSSVYYDPTQKKGKFILQFGEESKEYFDILIVATGSNRKVWNWMEALGHKIISPVPSLFTLELESNSITSLSGLSMPQASIRLLPKGKWQTGALLITHWGLSGPCALRLSAWEARTLHELNYNSPIEINWLGESSSQNMEEILTQMKIDNNQSKIQNKKISDFPQRLWDWILDESKIEKNKKWIDVSKNEIRNLTLTICHTKFQMINKAVFKEEFVTAGGISRKDINFKTMESKIIPNLFFTGEVIDIDGITGGFNFQNAWTTATIAAREISNRLVPD
jgi:predicted Rossmann fold flavoprotein